MSKLSFFVHLRSSSYDKSISEYVLFVLFYLSPFPRSVISGRNTVHLIASQSLFTLPDISQSLFWRGLGENEVE